MVNKFNCVMIEDFKVVIDVVKVNGDIKGLIVILVKFIFIVGVDIIEFGVNFV